MQILGKNRI